MKIITNRFNMGIFLILILLYISVQGPAQSPPAKTDKTEQEMADTFKAAKQSMYRKEWSKATTLFGQILEQSQNNALTDDSLYWLAYCLNQSSQELEKPMELLAQQKKHWHTWIP